MMLEERPCFQMSHIHTRFIITCCSLKLTTQLCVPQGVLVLGEQPCDRTPELLIGMKRVPTQPKLASSPADR